MSLTAKNRHKTAPRGPARTRRRALRGLLLILIVILAATAWPTVQSSLPGLLPGRDPVGTSSPAMDPNAGQAAAGQPSPSPSATGTSPPTPTRKVEVTPSEEKPAPRAGSDTGDDDQGLWVLALAEGSGSHLFAFQPQSLPLTRLTAGPWEDRHPAVSPEGQQVAFTSNRSGYWELYLMALANGQVTQLTESAAYEGAPSWSPDGLWLAYETYLDDNLEIYVRPIPGDQPPIPLTSHPAADFAPAWSPAGRHIAFVSTRTGEPEIWLADLDRPGVEGLVNLSRTPDWAESSPSWSPDGESLAWVSIREGIRGLYVWERRTRAVRFVGGGDWPAWSPDGKALLTRLETPHQTYLTVYNPQAPGLVSLAPLAMPQDLYGLTWVPMSLPEPLPEPYAWAAAQNPVPVGLPALTPNPEVPAGRQGVVLLEDIEAPYPQMHDLVDESFHALRARAADQIGWDLLASLENAFVPLTAPLPPGMGADWLYTGRAFALTTVPLNAGWMAVVREDFGAQTFWRVFVRARYQDGSQGIPLRALTWDFSARDRGDVLAYERGGEYADQVPPGYWVDFTHLATTLGWERLAALGNWRTFYQGARLNEFVQTQGMTWEEAMLELYPPEVLITPTPIVPPTRTPSPTPRWYRTPTPTVTPSPRPTFTPSPTLTSPPVTLSP